MELSKKKKNRLDVIEAVGIKNVSMKFSSPRPLMFVTRNCRDFKSCAAAAVQFLMTTINLLTALLPCAFFPSQKRLFSSFLRNHSPSQHLSRLLVDALWDCLAFDLEIGVKFIAFIWLYARSVIG